MPEAANGSVRRASMKRLRGRLIRKRIPNRFQEHDRTNTPSSRAPGGIGLTTLQALSAGQTTRLRVSAIGIVQRMMVAIGATDRAAIDALGSALQGSGRPLVTTFATMGLAGAPGELAPRSASEEDGPNFRSAGYVRAINEDAVTHWARRNVRASLVRLAPSVHGDGDKGLVPQLISAARKTGEALYVDEGANRWCGVHRNDAAGLFRLALEKAPPGGIYHGVGDEGASFRDIAEAIGRGLSVPVRRKTPAEAKKSLGFLAPFVSTDKPVEAALTQQRLGWKPHGPTLMEDLGGPAGYF